MKPWKRITIATATLLLSACGMGTANDHLSGMQANMQTLATEVQADRQFFKSGTDTANQMSGTLSRATDALEKAVSKTDTLGDRLDSFDAHISKVADSADAIAQSTSKFPDALNALNKTAASVANAAEGSQTEIKRVADNMAVMVAYLAVGMKFGMDYINHLPAAPAATATPGAAAPGNPTPVPPSVTTTVVPAKDTDTVSSSLLDDDPPKKDAP